jgi:hypothetical protein
MRVFTPISQAFNNIHHAISFHRNSKNTRNINLVSHRGL